MSLSTQIHDRSSPVFRFLNEHFPFLRSIQRSYLDLAPELLIPPCSANPGTLGAAYDWRVRLLLEEQPDMNLPLTGAMRIGRSDLVELLAALLTESGIQAVLRLGNASSSNSDRPSLPRASRSDEWLIRLAWAIACYTELFRTGMIWPGSPLARLSKGASPEDLLALCPDDAVADIAALVEVTKGTLVRVIENHPPLHVGPTFAGSAAVQGADADFVAGGTLVDLKSGAGDKRKDGSRRCSLDKDVLFQLIGYVLLDWDNAFEIHMVAIYAVRFDYLRSWPIDQLVAETRIGQPDLSLNRLREDFRRAVTRVGELEWKHP